MPAKAVPNDPYLYQKAHDEARRVYKKPSAFRSGYASKLYKTMFKEKHGGRRKPYKGSKGENDLARWFKEDWRNQRARSGSAPKGSSEGYKSKSDIFRPTKRVSKKTPTTMGELSGKEVDRARREKARTGRVRDFKKKK